MLANIQPGVVVDVKQGKTMLVGSSVGTKINIYK